jgi:hypothetical protein
MVLLRIPIATIINEYKSVTHYNSELIQNRKTEIQNFFDFTFSGFFPVVQF